MNEDTTVIRPDEPNSNWRTWRWILPAALAILILAVLGGAYLATHHSTAASPTKTPTPTVTPRPTAAATHIPTATAPPKATSTPKVGPTGTPRPGPTGTPRPAPTATPKPAATTAPTPAPTKSVATPAATTGTSSGVATGTVTFSQAQLQSIQKSVDQNNPSYTYYLDPFKVIQRDLPAKYGFSKGPLTIVSPQPPPQPTPTPASDAQGLPEVTITVQYQGKTYAIVLNQPETQGAKGIWVIAQITPH